MSDLFSSLPPDRLADFRPRPTDTDHISESGLDLNMHRHIPREISHVTMTRATDVSARWPVTYNRGMERLAAARRGGCGRSNIRRNCSGPVGYGPVGGYRHVGNACGLTPKDPKDDRPHLAPLRCTFAVTDESI